MLKGQELGHHQKTLPERDVSSRSESDSKSSNTPDLEEENREALQSWDAAILDEVSMLQITKCTSKFEEGELFFFYALLLRSVIGQDAHFRRVGIADIPDVDALGVDGWESKNCAISTGRNSGYPCGMPCRG